MPWVIFQSPSVSPEAVEDNSSNGNKEDEEDENDEENDDEKIDAQYDPERLKAFNVNIETTFFFNF